MRINLKKITLMAGFSLAMVFTSCGGSKPPVAESAAPTTAPSATPPPPPTGFSDVSTPADELTTKCRTELKDYLCGIGENTSTNSQIARDVATANARNELSSKIKTSVQSALKRVTNNALTEAGNEATFQKLMQDISEDLVGVDIYETKTQYNQAENKYKIFALVVVKKDDIKNVANNKAINAKILSDAAASKVFSDMIEEELNKKR